MATKYGATNIIPSAGGPAMSFPDSRLQNGTIALGFSDEQKIMSFTKSGSWVLLDDLESDAFFPSFVTTGHGELTYLAYNSSSGSTIQVTIPSGQKTIRISGSDTNVYFTTSVGTVLDVPPKRIVEINMLFEPNVSTTMLCEIFIRAALI